MAVSLNPRAERLLARLPRFTVYSLLELLLLVLIAVQCARLFWAVLTPLGPVGEWKALDLMRTPPAPGPRLGSFDPFFRQAPGAPGTAQAPVVVTALDIRLHGITANRATGGGSAIIGTANGQQKVFLVGEEIMPGVTLTGVAFDHIIINRNGTAEQLYLDQSPAPGPANTAPPGMAPGSQPQFAPPAPVVRPPPITTTPTPAPPPPQPVPTAQTLKVDQ